MDDSSYSRQQLDDLFLKMIAYYAGDPKRIQHFTKVHSYARIIGVGEEMDAASLFILEAAAYTHDIGIKPAEENMEAAMESCRSRKDRSWHRKCFRNLALKISLSTVSAILSATIIHMIM